MAVRIFFCYAREDESHLRKLQKHLKPLQKQGLIDTWYDRNISPGTEWEEEIHKALHNAHIILLLVSSDFMDSDYCYGVEMQQALERHKRGEAKVIPIILRPIYWQEILGQLQALPTDGKPAIDPTWHDIDIAYNDIAEGIRKIVKEQIKLSQASTQEGQASRIKAKDEEASPISSMTVTPVAKHSIGLIERKDNIDIIFNVLKINEALPTQKTRIFTTVEANQEMVCLTLMENDSDNDVVDIRSGKEIGQVTLTLPSHLPMHAPIEVTFMLDLASTLHITAKELVYHSIIEATIDLNTK